MDISVLIPLLIVLIGLLLLSQSRKRREALQIPAGVPIYQDSPEERGEILYSRRLRVKGRPDLLIRQADVIIPVEVKTGKTPNSPYPNHVMQLIVYCVLVEENYGTRPTHGFIRYPEHQFEVDFTPELEHKLEQIVVDMRQKRRAEDVHRSHNNPRICAACDLRDYCDEELELPTQAVLFDL